METRCGLGLKKATVLLGAGDVVGDGEDDVLSAVPSVHGVTSETEDMFSFRYVVDDAPVPGFHNFATDFGLAGPVAVGFVVIPLGPVQPGVLPTEVVVDLPLGGGTSRYHVVVAANAYSCSSTNAFRPFRWGEFTGDARWGFGEDGTGTLGITSATGVSSVPLPENPVLNQPCE